MIDSVQTIKTQNCYHIETVQVIFRANQLTGSYMMTTLVYNWLTLFLMEH